MRRTTTGASAVCGLAGRLVPLLLMLWPAAAPAQYVGGGRPWSAGRMADSLEARADTASLNGLRDRFEADSTATAGSLDSLAQASAGEDGILHARIDSVRDNAGGGGGGGFSPATITIGNPGSGADYILYQDADGDSLLQVAFDAVADSAGGNRTILVRVDSMLIDDTVYAGSGIVLKGIASRPRIRIAGGITAFLDTTGTEGFRLESLYFHGMTSGGWTHAVFGTEGVQARGFAMSHCRVRAISAVFDADTTGGNISRYWTLEDCDIDSCYSILWHVQDYTIRNCEIDSGYGPSQIEVMGGNAVIEGNRFRWHFYTADGRYMLDLVEPPTGTGANLTYGNRIVDNLFLPADTMYNDYAVGASDFYGASANWAEVLFVGNTVGGPGDRAWRVGIGNHRPGGGWQIHDNQFYTRAQALSPASRNYVGIMRQSIKNNLIVGVNASSTGIIQYNDYSVIRGNHIVDCATGINVVTNYNVVTDNSFKDCSTDISDSGTGNVLRTNDSL